MLFRRNVGAISVVRAKSSLRTAMCGEVSSGAVPIAGRRDVGAYSALNCAESALSGAEVVERRSEGVERGDQRRSDERYLVRNRYRL